MVCLFDSLPSLRPRPHDREDRTRTSARPRSASSSISGDHSELSSSQPCTRRTAGPDPSLHATTSPQRVGTTRGSSVDNRSATRGSRQPFRDGVLAQERLHRVVGVGLRHDNGVCQTVGSRRAGRRHHARVADARVRAASDRSAATRHRADPGSRSGRGARPGAGDPAQPQRPRAHQRRQHDGAARAARTARAWKSWAWSTRAARAPRRSTGARVVATTKGANGGFAEYAVCPAASTFDMPDVVPLPDAAALFFPFHLAWLGLFDRADLQAGESVLIHAGAGGSGSAAIQLAAHRARASSPPRAATKRSRCAASSAPTSPSTTRRPTSVRSCSRRPAGAAWTSCSTTWARP